MRAAWAVAWAFLARAARGGPITNPVADRADLDGALPWYLADLETTKYHLRDGASAAADAAEAGGGGGTTLSWHSREYGNALCPLALQLEWSADTGEHLSGIVAAPLVRRLYGSENKQIIAPTSSEVVTMLESDGYASPGWPLVFQGRMFHTSPTVADVDLDGRDEVLVADTDGRVLFLGVGDRGEYLLDHELRVPRLLVWRDWHLKGPDASPRHLQPETSIFEDLHSLSEAERAGAASSWSPPAPRPEVRGEPADTATANGARRLLFASEGGGGAGGFDFGDEHAAGDDAAGAGGGEYGYGGDPLGAAPRSEYVAVTPHLLANPLAFDVDGDGADEILLAVSYFFDASLYSAEAPPEPGVEDPSRYVASALLAYSASKKDFLWRLHLDLAAESSGGRAYAFGDPFAGDLDGDGSAEVVVATSLGFLYVVDARNGFARRGYPKRFGEIVGGTAVADAVSSSGGLEILVGDLRGNLVCLSAAGEPLWENLLPGEVRFAPTLGDLNGDGAIDVVVTAYDAAEQKGLLLAFAGEDGAALPGYPLREAARFTSQALLVDLHLATAGESAVRPDPQAAAQLLRSAEAGARSPRLPQPIGGGGGGLHVVVPASDGHVYVVEGATGCANRVDIGEEVHAMPLAEDVSGSGTMDLVVATATGDVAVFDTGVPYNALNAWPGQLRGGRNGFVHGRAQGVRVVGGAGCRTVIGNAVQLRIEIVDVGGRGAPYDVAVATGAAKRVARFLYEKPGAYTLVLPLPAPGHTPVTVSMTTHHGLFYEDSTCIRYNVDFYRPLKFALLLPLMAASAIGLLYRENTQLSL